MFETAQRGIAVNEAVKRFFSSSWYCLPDTVPLPGNDLVNQSLRQQLIEVPEIAIVRKMHITRSGGAMFGWLKMQATAYHVFR